jgi:hypothetical protein
MDTPAHVSDPAWVKAALTAVGMPAE